MKRDFFMLSSTTCLDFTQYINSSRILQYFHYPESHASVNEGVYDSIKLSRRAPAHEK